MLRTHPSSKDENNMFNSLLVGEGVQLETLAGTIHKETSYEVFGLIVCNMLAMYKLTTFIDTSTSPSRSPKRST